MLRRVFTIVLFALFAVEAAAQSFVPDRRQVVTQDTDFFGAPKDLGEAVGLDWDSQAAHAPSA